MVVGPSMSGKSFFVKQMLERDHIEYDDPRKQRRIHWFYGQYQDMFKDMRRNMGKDIHFKQGLPEFEPDLCEGFVAYICCRYSRLLQTGAHKKVGLRRDQMLSSV